MKAMDFRSFEEWEGSVPRTVTDDPVWRIEAYRLALFVGDLGLNDVSRLNRNQLTIEEAQQLHRALGSIGANIAEGFSRGGRRDWAQFYRYALGSARECTVWYYRSRFVLGSEVFDHRSEILANIIRLLDKMIPPQNNSSSRKRRGANASLRNFGESLE